jgi:hypothetical protein
VVTPLAFPLKFIFSRSSVTVGEDFINIFYLHISFWNSVGFGVLFWSSFV